jgi:hypothetical protein
MGVMDTVDPVDTVDIVDVVDIVEVGGAEVAGWSRGRFLRSAALRSE